MKTKSNLQKCNKHVGWCAEHQVRHGVKAEDIRVHITGGYNGVGEIRVYIDDIEHKIDKDYLENYILELMEDRGYTISKEKRQKYPRITINK